MKAMENMFLGKGWYEGKSVEIYMDNGEYFIDKGKGLELVEEDEMDKVYFDPLWR